MKKITDKHFFSVAIPFAIHCAAIMLCIVLFTLNEQSTMYGNTFGVTASTFAAMIAIWGFHCTILDKAPAPILLFLSTLLFGICISMHADIKDVTFYIKGGLWVSIYVLWVIFPLFKTKEYRWDWNSFR